MDTRENQHALSFRIFCDSDDSPEVHLLLSDVVDLKYTNDPHAPNFMMYFKFADDPDELDRLVKKVRRLSRGKPRFTFYVQKHDPCSNIATAVQDMERTNYLAFGSWIMIEE